MIRAIILLLAAATTACGPDAPTGSPDADLDTTPVPLEAVDHLDLLVIIDNSPAMADEQDRFLAGFAPLAERLLQATSVHIGVVSSNMGIPPRSSNGCMGNGDNGRFQNAPRGACTPPSGYYISYETDALGNEIKNYTGTLADNFSCVARLGTTGCGFEQHLEAVKASLDGRNPENQSFLREHAWLGVIILADEDDCSAENGSVFDTSQDGITEPLGHFSSFRCTEFGVQCGGMDIARTEGEYQDCEPYPDTDTNYLWHPSHYVDWLRDLKGTGIVTTAIVGDPQPFTVGTDLGEPLLGLSCIGTDDGSRANPGVRLDWFARAFGPLGATHSACSDDYAAVEAAIAEQIGRALMRPCIRAPINTIDLSPDPGLQIGCRVTADGTTLPHCDLQPGGIAVPGTTPCWWSEVAAPICGGDTLLHVENVAPSAALAAECVQ